MKIRVPAVGEQNFPLYILKSPDFVKVDVNFLQRLKEYTRLNAACDTLESRYYFLEKYEKKLRNPSTMTRNRVTNQKKARIVPTPKKKNSQNYYSNTIKVYRTQSY